MSETTITCVRGCTIAGQHMSDCDGVCGGCARKPGAHRKECDRRCRGCLPRPAEIGALCWWCIKRLRETLAEIPALIAWLREAGSPLSRLGSGGDGRAIGDVAETVPMHAAVLDADELEREVAWWAMAVVEEHPAGLRGPKAAGVHPAAWLDAHHASIATMGLAEEIVSALTKITATLRAKFPPPWSVEPARKVHIPCPRCGSMSLTYTPQAWAFQPFRVSCGDPDCGRIFSEDEWDRIKALAHAGKRGWVA